MKKIQVNFSIPLTPLHISAVLLTFGGIIFTVFAVPLYTPGQTLEPACAPGATDCTVLLPDGNSLDASDGDPVNAVVVDTEGDVGIGTATPAADALLDLTSSSKALLVTRLADPSAIGTEVNGMIAYDSTDDELQGYINGAWVNVGGSGGLTDILSDTTPQLGGDLDVNNRNITSATGVDISIGSSSGNDFTVDTNKLVVEGDTGNVGVGITAPTSILHVEGSLSLQQTTVTSTPTTLDNTHNVVLVNVSGDSAINLPAAASHTDKVYYIKKIDADNDEVTIDGNASETIDGATTLVLYVQYDAVRIISDGSNWHVISDELKPHVAKIYRSAAQSIPNRDWTYIEFDGVELDNADLAAVDGPGGSTDTITIKRAGNYLLGSKMNTDDVDSGEYVQYQIKRNGSSLFNVIDHSSIANGVIAFVNYEVASLNAGDYLQIQVYNTTNETENTLTNSYWRPSLSATEIR